jgi:tRNA pseudouridine55 synthase
MSRRRKGRDLHGIILLDKPAGMTSNQALQAVRRLLGARKCGHTGSLDPFATGLLPLCFGEATKTAGYMLDADKTYSAVARLGEATTTGDSEGEVNRRMAVPPCSSHEIADALEEFQGDYSQVPPMYSALKHQGRPLYSLARAGVEVEREARRVRIYSLRLLEWDPPLLSFHVQCSKGTYIRTLAEDIAARLGTCAHLVALRREGVGDFETSGTMSIDALEAMASEGDLEAALLPADGGLNAWPVVRLDDRQSAVFGHGNPQAWDTNGPGWVRVYGPENRLLGLGEVDAGGRLCPRRVFNIA